MLLMKFSGFIYWLIISDVLVGVIFLECAILLVHSVWLPGK